MRRTLENECVVATRAVRLSLPPLFTRAWGKTAGLLASLKPPMAAGVGRTVRGAPRRNRPSVLKSCRGKPDWECVRTGVEPDPGVQGRLGECLKSCLSAFVTPFVFLLLLLVAPTSAFAATEADQEIGVPQAMDSKAKGCFGVVLSPDGDGFYSVRDGLLAHYRIAPFKKIGSIAIDEAQLKDIAEKDSCRVLITDDGSKLIVVFPEWIVSLDRSTGKIIKKLGREGTLKRGQLEASTLNGNDLVMLGAISEGFRLTVVDARSLQFKMQISDLEDRFKFLYTDTGCCFITKIQDRLYLTSGRSLVVLNSKTYAPELTVSGSYSIGAGISKDYRKLYLRSGRFVTDRLSHFEKDYGESAENNAVLVFDQETRQIHFEETNSEKEQIKAHLRDQYDPMLFTRNPSRNRDYVTASLRSYTLIRSRNTDIRGFFYQYESGEAILIETRPKGPRRVESFQLTPGARQYLMMKNSAGQIVPINDATFAKYHAHSTR